MPAKKHWLMNRRINRISPSARECTCGVHREKHYFSVRKFCNRIVTIDVFAHAAAKLLVYRRVHPAQVLIVVTVLGIFPACRSAGRSCTLCAKLDVNGWTARSDSRLRTRSTERREVLALFLFVRPANDRSGYPVLVYRSAFQASSP